MSDELYIWVTRWIDFQHYLPQRERGPAWIKDYTAQLNDAPYLRLSDRQRALLRDLRDIFATFRAQLPYDPAMIARQRNSQTRRDDLGVLSRAGFIDIVSREVLDQRLEELYSASRRTLASRAPAQSQEAEAEEERDKSSGGKLLPPAADGYEPNGLPFTNEILYQRLLEYVGAHGDENTPAVIRSYVNRATEAQLANVLESTHNAHPRNRAKYVVGALRDEIGSAERTAA